MKIYGIKNCDTMKKARKWLDDNGQSVEFIDYKKDGLSPARLTEFVEALGWQALVNKRGTTYRQLDEQLKANMDEASAIEAMLANPSIIKRPLLVKDGQYLLGFKADLYQQFVSPLS
ncbi:MAG: ArsC family reductase [Bermanella sp.]